MLLGVLAQETEGTVGGAPSTAFATADFVNGAYDYNGSTLTASNVVNNTGVITGSGLHLVAGATPVYFLNQFRTKLFTFDWTILLELNIDVFTGNEMRVLHVGSETVSFGYQNDVKVVVWGDYEAEDHNGDYPGTPPGTGSSVDRYIADSTNAETNAIHKLGVTRTDAMISLSVDGYPVHTLNSPTFSINFGAGATDANAAVGGWRWAGETISNTFYLRSLKIYDPPLSNVALVALTGA
jgi:hypothetical protein